MALKFLISADDGLIADTTAAPAPLYFEAPTLATQAQSKFGGWSVYGPDGSSPLFETSYNGSYNKVAEVVAGIDMTLECWVYFTTASASENVVLEIYGWASYSLGIRQLLRSDIGTSRQFEAFAVGPLGTAVHSSVILSAGSWHHLALVAAADQSSFYADGVRVSADSANVSSWDDDPNGSSTILWSCMLDMYVDDVALSNVARYTGATYSLPGAYVAGPEPASIRIALPGPLAKPAVRAVVPAVARCTAPALLGSAFALAHHDFTALLGNVLSVYVMDLITPTGAVRVPISSWQATLQTGAKNYVQCVVPACTMWVAALATATEFVIYRRAVLPSGAAIEYEMARAPASTPQFDRGPARHTCTLSGYSTAFVANDAPDAAYDRTLTGVRSVSSGSGMRVRCAVDWLLRPGQRAMVDDTPLLVGYINYYAPSGFDSYMDVGEQA